MCPPIYPAPSALSMPGIHTRFAPHKSHPKPPQSISSRRGLMRPAAERIFYQFARLKCSLAVGLKD